MEGPLGVVLRGPEGWGHTGIGSENTTHSRSIEGSGGNPRGGAWEKSIPCFAAGLSG